MLGVLGIGLSLGLGLPAREVLRDKGYHAHVWIRPVVRPTPPKPGQTRYTTSIDSAIRSPFWPRYWRRLAGLPWDRTVPCRPRAGELELYCKFEHSEICERRTGPPFLTAVSVPSALWPVLHRLNGESSKPGLVAQ